MKRYLILLIIFIPFIVHADLTAEQSEAIAEFSKNMIIKQAEAPHVDSNGFGLMAYSQGQRRNEGFQQKLSYFNKDYRNVNYIGGNKWAFDCSSWVSYIYYHVLGVQTYTGSMHPFVVSEFVSQAERNNTWYFVMRRKPVKGLDYSQLKKGDLVIIEGSHIMIYIGDKHIAHVSQTAIAKGSNLGAQVIALETKYPNEKVSIARLKSSSAKPVTTITWPDTHVTQRLTNDEEPKIKYELSPITNKELTISITLTDDIGLTNYQVNQSSDTPFNWLSINNKKEFKTSFKVSKDGTYYIHAKDSTGHTVKQKVVINEFTNQIIIDSYTLEYNNKENSFTLEIVCTKTNCSNYSYSLDGKKYQKDNKFKDIKETTYTLHVKDKYNNTLTKDIEVKKDAVPKFDLTYDNTKYSSQIDVKINSTINEYAVTKESNIPSSFQPYDNTPYTVKENGTYYFWLKNKDGNVTYDSITIDKIDNVKPIINNVQYKKKLLTDYVIVYADDKESGIEGYSIDGTNFQKSNEMKVDQSNRTVYVRDNCGNISEYNITIAANNNILYIILGGLILLLIIFVILKKVKEKKNDDFHDDNKKVSKDIYNDDDEINFNEEPY